MRRLLPLLLCALACTDASSPDESKPLPGAFAAVAAGAQHTCGVSVTSEMFCWGANQQGQLGDGTTTAANEPTLASGDVRFVDVSAGGEHTCALGPSGELYCWGANEHGQLGSNDRVAKHVPTHIEPQIRWAEVSAGTRHTCAITSDRRMYCWGWGAFGVTGAPSDQDVLAPRPIDTQIRFVAVAAGGTHTCAIDTGNIGHCWGSNDRGQLGDASFADRRLPGRPVFGDVRFTQIEAGESHTCAVGMDARAYCWGSNIFGEIGEGAPASEQGGAVTPYPVRINPGVRWVTAGTTSSCLVDAVLAAWCWGRGNEGQLGNGSRFHYVVPNRVNGADLTASTLAFVQVDMGSHHACGLTTAKSVYCWGRGDDGQIGAGPFLYSTLPVRVRDGS
jgi:alpha-tubulin suppressor-like RCC1 family protein